jgi:PAS domain S-box-containing protein
MTWSTDTSGRWNQFSQGWLDFTGRTIHQEINDGWLEGMHPEDIVTCLPIYLDAFRRGAPFEMEVRLLHRDGSWHWVRVHGAPSFDGAGTFLGFAGSCGGNGARREAAPSSSGDGPC